jgi:hypothetical protein
MRRGSMGTRMRSAPIAQGAKPPGLGSKAFGAPRAFRLQGHFGFKAFEAPRKFGLQRGMGHQDAGLAAPRKGLLPRKQDRSPAKNVMRH